MSSTAPVALILGAGSRVGQHVARAFTAKGYKVALASRSLKEEDSTADSLNITSDFADPASIAQAFAKVKAKFGLPHVVVYNAAALTPSNPKNPLDIPLDSFARDLAINTTSAFAAAQQAAAVFKELPASASRTFIYTGNCLNVTPIASVLDLGVGKSGIAHAIEIAAEAYKDSGFKFYYADERNTDGTPVGNNLDGPAHAEHYASLVEHTEQGPWQQTFVKEIGYKKF